MDLEVGNELAKGCTVHGVFLCVAGVGTLIIGDSGVGKSDCALELLSRGHALVADDAVQVHRIGDHLYAKSSDLLSGFLEIRGLGIVDVRQLFGSASVAEKQRIELCIEFQDRNASNEIDRISAGTQEFELLGLKMPKFVFTVGDGRSHALFVETAVKLLREKNAGCDAERELAVKYDNAIAARSVTG